MIYVRQQRLPTLLAFLSAFHQIDNWHRFIWCFVCISDSFAFELNVLICFSSVATDESIKRNIYATICNPYYMFIRLTIAFSVVEQLLKKPRTEHIPGRNRFWQVNCIFFRVLLAFYESLCSLTGTVCARTFRLKTSSTCNLFVTEQHW